MLQIAEARFRVDVVIVVGHKFGNPALWKRCDDVSEHGFLLSDPLLRKCASTEGNQADRLLNHGGGSKREIALMESLPTTVTRDETLVKKKMCRI